MGDPDSNEASSHSSSEDPSTSLSPRDWGALLLAWIPYSALIWRFWFVTDDAYISFRFARNWADGVGLRYNIGEHVPVEGFSNFLWVALTACVEKLGQSPVLWMPILSALAGFALTALVFQALRQTFGLSRLVSSLTVAALGCSAPFAVWSTGGLETMSFALLLFVTFRAIVLRPNCASGLQGGLFGLMTALSRPEGVYWVLLVFVLGWSSRRRKGESSQLGIAVLILLTGYALFTAWRLSSFGHVLPTSATAKLSAGFGLDRIERGARYVSAQFLSTLSLFALVPATWEALRARRRELSLPILALALGFPLWAILVSGDFMAFARFLVPGLSFLALLSGLLLARIIGEANERKALGVVLALLVAALGALPAWGFMPVPRSIREALNFRPHLDGFRSEFVYWNLQRVETRRWAERGKALAQIASPGESIAISAIGAVGYHSRLFVFDRVGLVTREIAELTPEGDARDHTPGHDNPVEVQWFLNRGERPTYIRANFVECSSGEELLEKVAHSEQQMKASGLKKFYVLDIRQIEPTKTSLRDEEASESSPSKYFMTWRIIPKGTPSRTAWESLNRAVRAHLDGDAFPIIQLDLGEL